MLQALSHPQTTIFAPLLASPQIAALAQSPEHASIWNLLQIFSYGTYHDYTTASPKLPGLSGVQATKLRQLSLLNLARYPEKLTYPALLAELSLDTPRELEDLIISAIYAGLISGTLDPYHQTARLTSVAPLRDLAPDTIPMMLSTLEQWSGRCTQTLGELDEQIRLIKMAAARRGREDSEWEAQVEKLHAKSVTQAGKDGKEKEKEKEKDSTDVDTLKDGSKSGVPDSSMTSPEKRAAGGKRTATGMANETDEAGDVDMLDEGDDADEGLGGMGGDGITTSRVTRSSKKRGTGGKGK